MRKFSVESFDREHEIDDWLEGNFKDYWPNAIYLKGFKIKTPHGKGGIPDGFILDPKNNQWFVIENELLRHGVWTHIAEQLVRFVVASNHPESVQKIRDRVFEQLTSDDAILDNALSLFGVREVKLLTAIEKLLEYPPKLLVFIDEVNEDLHQLVRALAIDTELYTLMKIKDKEDNISIFSPTLKEKKPVIETENSVKVGSAKITTISTIEKLGLELEGNRRGFKWYKMPDGKLIHLKYSKFYERNETFWYGVKPSNFEVAKENGIDRFGFITSDEGVLIVETNELVRYCETARKSTWENGEIKHFHIFISAPPEPTLFQYGSDNNFISDFVKSDS